MNINELLKNTYSPRPLFLSVKPLIKRKFGDCICIQILNVEKSRKAKTCEKKRSLNVNKTRKKITQRLPKNSPEELGQGLLILAVNKAKESNKNLSLDPL